MPLYNNILLSRKADGSVGAPTKGSPSGSMKLLQDHLLSKRRSLQQSASPKVQKQTPDRSQQQLQPTPETRSSQIIISESTLHKPAENDWNPEDEYDPMAPNSYEVLLTDYLKAEEQRLAEQRKSAASSKVNVNLLLDALDKLEAEDEDDSSSSSTNNKKSRGTAIAPPPSLSATSGPLTEVDETDSGASKSAIKPTVPSTGTPISLVEGDGGSSVAAKIMSKMGYRVGQGLGRDEQGISAPLEVEKSGTNAGRIVVGAAQKPIVSPKEEMTMTTTATAPPSKELATETKQPAQNKMAELLRNSTRVLLLQNMVGPGEVDDDLEAETKEECKKYGEVVKCLIYEIPNKRVPDDEAVRIFVEFRQVESAIKAVSDLNGRYFGGRIVRASFYSLERFRKYELGPGAG